eukprot:gnl/MRDRNA2_/MRDRNA2_76692_c0_seq2.p1 gnl/MRDRNA2_/MRDRNA2_76692_c0~~gnl/MRDRNA2_/MRDRNA2_76692_c0_seq2.p1  ORF type:complete len:554 (+),score=136.15 gnl/MRDRNA2_/MRDRNA2_76692_c0_seq2:84-1745(+)
MNSQSSRSHAIVQFFISEKSLVGAGSLTRTTLKLRLKKAVSLTWVDLAGSEKPNWEDTKLWPNLDDEERSKRTGEGKVINTGLSELAKCIRAAAGQENAFCSHRNDMLTVMLQPLWAVGANGRGAVYTRMLATVNPSSDTEQVSLTIGSMKYATDVKKIKVPSPVGVGGGALAPVTEHDKTHLLEIENAKLKQKVADCEKGQHAIALAVANQPQKILPPPNAASGDVSPGEQQMINQMSEDESSENQRLLNELMEAKASIKELETAVEVSEQENKNLKDELAPYVQAAEEAARTEAARRKKMTEQDVKNGKVICGAAMSTGDILDRTTGTGKDKFFDTFGQYGKIRGWVIEIDRLIQSVQAKNKTSPEEVVHPRTLQQIEPRIGATSFKAMQEEHPQITVHILLDALINAKVLKKYLLKGKFRDIQGGLEDINKTLDSGLALLEGETQSGHVVLGFFVRQWIKRLKEAGDIVQILGNCGEEDNPLGCYNAGTSEMLYSHLTDKLCKTYAWSMDNCNRMITTMREAQGLDQEAAEKALTGKKFEEWTATPMCDE